MKTEIAKNFSWGFFLSEQELRGVSDTLLEQVVKLDPSASRLNYFARLTDATVVESHDVDGLLSLENGGSKSIEKLTVSATAEKFSVELTIQDGYRNPKTWTSITFTITGPNREWVFLASSELEERLKRFRVTSWPYLLSSPWPYVVALVAAIVAANWIDDLSFPRTTNAEELRALYESGQVTDAIQAPIAAATVRIRLQIERARSPVRRPAWCPRVEAEVVAGFVAHAERLLGQLEDPLGKEQSRGAGHALVWADFAAMVNAWVLMSSPCRYPLGRERNLGDRRRDRQS